MKLWIDQQLSPYLVSWLRKRFELEVDHVRDLGLREAEDHDIFEAGRLAEAVVMTKDRDFVELVGRQGAPPQVLWITCGNTTNEALRRILGETLGEALILLERGEPLVEISDDVSDTG